jgi:hypothetical protein
MEREIVVFEGESRLVCFSADIGTALPYQVIVGVNGKGERPASGKDINQMNVYIITSYMTMHSHLALKICTCVRPSILCTALAL